MKPLLHYAAEAAIEYVAGLNRRRVFPDFQALKGLEAFDEALPQVSCDPMDTLRLLNETGGPATVASAGPRYFGFVIGGALPVTLAANWLAGAWDQNAGLWVATPVSATLEQVALNWLVELFGLPSGTGGGFVTGATMANFTALAAARHAVLAQAGWDVESQGLIGAPAVTVIVGEEVHASVLKTLGLLGLGRDRVVRAAVDGQGRIDPDELPAIEGPTILCLQAGNVNTGSFDPAEEIIPRAREAGAWVHVDGAFGLWAAASPRHAHLAAGYELADSWATDAHKYLNVPYDSGVVFCREPQAMQAAMATHAAYLVEGERREPSHYTPELSRRARGIEIWAALRTLGRAGVAALVERTCSHALRFTNGVQAAGYSVLNEVVLNQVLVSFGDPESTRRVIAGVQEDGTFWAGGTVWQGHTAMRVSFSSWATTEDDVDASLEAVLRVAAGVTDPPPGS